MTNKNPQDEDGYTPLQDAVDFDQFEVVKYLISIQDVDVTSRAEIMGALTTMSIFILLMSLGVWHVFRKRGRIYI